MLVGHLHPAQISLLAFMYKTWKKGEHFVARSVWDITVSFFTIRSKAKEVGLSNPRTWTTLFGQWGRVSQVRACIFLLKFFFFHLFTGLWKGRCHCVLLAWFT